MVAWPASRPTLLIALAVALAARTTLGADQTTPVLAETISPLQARFQGMTSDELFSKLLEHNRIRDLRLRQYSVIRTYEVTNDKGKFYAGNYVVNEDTGGSGQDLTTENQPNAIR